MELLIVSIGALCLGPVLARVFQRDVRSAAALDGFVLTSLMVIVLFTVAPEALESAGWIALPAALVGLVAPGLTERLLTRTGERREHHAVVATLALSGLGLHAMGDGAALVHGHGGHDSASLLPLGVIVHRVPVGLILWTRLSARSASVVLGWIVLATAVGYAGGAATVDWVSSASVGVFQAFVAGSLMHVALEPPVSAPRRELDPRWSGVGALLALGALTLVFPDHHGAPGTEPDSVLAAFATLAFESAPALLLAFAGAGLLHGFLEARTVRWLDAPSRFQQSLRGMAFGLPLPLCSCGVLPVYGTLVRAGAPAAAGFAFLVATPEIGLDAFFLSFSLLGQELAIARIVCAAAVAAIAGLVLGRMLPAHTPVTLDERASKDEGGSRLAASLRFGFVELFDHTMPWIVLGVSIAAVLERAVVSGGLANLPAGWDVVVMAVVGMPVYVCASGATPLAAVLMLKGLSPGAAVAFLLTGPATNVTTVGVLSRLHGRRVAVAFAVLVPALSVVAGWSVNALEVGAVIPAGLGDGHSHPTGLQRVALAGLAALCVYALLRRGPRGPRRSNA